MYSYTAYGLGLHSSLPLPELAAGEARKDVVVRFAKVSGPPPEAQTAERHYWATGQSVYLFWRELGTFRIREGFEIAIDPATLVEPGRLSPPILGACMAVALHQRGFLVLHASAVALNGRAVAFLGDKGWGKSTLAAALHGRGHHLLCDDVLAVDVEGAASPWALPAFPQLKLWPDAVASLGGDPDALPRLVPQLEKRQRRISGDFSQNPLPLERIYVLGKGPSLEIEPLQPGEVLGQLFAHSYGGRFGKQLLQHGEAKHFKQCAELAKGVPIYRLKRPSSLSLLPVTAQLVEEHAAGEFPKLQLVKSVKSEE